MRLVSVYDPDFIGSPAYSIPVGGNVCSAAATGTYTAAALGRNNQPVVYNNNSGNWRFDEVNVLGTAAGTNPITSDPIVNTTGSGEPGRTPGGGAEYVPDSSPVYQQDAEFGLRCRPRAIRSARPSNPNGNFNDDVEVVRIATTTNFINFTDITPFNTPQFPSPAARTPRFRWSTA